MSKYILFYADVEWEKFNRREMIIELSKILGSGYQLIVINRPSNIIPGLFRNKTHRNKILESINKPINIINDNLYVVRPLTLFHDHLGNLIFKGYPNIINNFFIKFFLKKNNLFPANNQDVTIWIYEQIHWTLSHLVKNKKVIWEIFDDYRYTAQGKERSMWMRTDKLMIEKSDVILTLTSGLKNKYDRYHKNVDVIGNGFFREFFYKENTNKTINKRFENINGIKIAFIGNIRDWINFDLLNEFIKSNIDKNFIFIGPIDNSAKHLFNKTLKFKNVHYMGSSEKNNLGYYLQNIDVAIIPYIKTSFTENVKPIKLFEILSSGTPVISSMTADLKEVIGALYFFNSLDELNLALDNCLSQYNRDKCIELADEWTWTNLINRNVLKHLK